MKKKKRNASVESVEYNLRNVQEEINRIYSQIMVNQQAMGEPRILIPRGSNVQDSQNFALQSNYQAQAHLSDQNYYSMLGGVGYGSGSAGSGSGGGTAGAGVAYGGIGGSSRVEIIHDEAGIMSGQAFSLLKELYDQPKPVSKNKKLNLPEWF